MTDATSSPTAATLFRKVLVPVDFSPPDDTSEAAVAAQAAPLELSPASSQAVALAVALVRASGGSLRLVHVTPPLDYHASYTGPAGLSLPVALIEEIHAETKRTSQALLDRLAASSCQGLEVSFAVRPGVAHQVLLQEIGDFGADLVVMAASGRNRVARFFVGSTADRLIREAGCPVLVVPAVSGPSSR